MKSVFPVPKIEQDLIKKIESYPSLRLSFYYSEVDQDNNDWSFFFKSIESNVSLVLSLSYPVGVVTAFLEKNADESKFIFIDSYLTNHGRQSMWESTRIWTGEAWITDLDKYLDLVLSVLEEELYSVIKGEIWIDDPINLDKYISRKK